MKSILLFLVYNEGACENIAFLKTILFVKKILEVVFIIVPMALMVMISFDFFKSVIASKEDAMKKNLNIVLKRTIFVVALFLVPTITNVMIDYVTEFTSYNDCWNVDEKYIDKQVKINKDKCNSSENYEWNENNSSCVRKANPVQWKDKIDDEVVKRKLIASSSSSSGSSAGDMVAYKQTDYSGTKFCSGKKTVESSGCGAVALATVASTLVSDGYDPSYVSSWLCNNGHGGGALGYNWFNEGTSASKKIEEKFGIKSTTLFSGGDSFSKSKKDKILSSVKAGKPVILLIPGHYITVGTHSNCDVNTGHVYAYNFYSRTGCYTMDDLARQVLLWGSSRGGGGFRMAWSYEKVN